MNARPTRPTGIFTARAALCLTLGAALLASSVPAFAGDDDVPIDTKIMRGVMESLGLRRDGEAINYEERAPLVIPPSHDLPPPERSDAAIANNPAWPIDPDVKRRKQEAAQARNSITSAGEQAEHDRRVLRPDELTPGPKPRKAPGTVNSIRRKPQAGVTAKYCRRRSLVIKAGCSACLAAARMKALAASPASRRAPL